MEFGYPMQLDYKSLRAAAIICTTLVNTYITHTQRQLLTGYKLSAQLAKLKYCQPASKQSSPQRQSWLYTVQQLPNQFNAKYISQQLYLQATSLNTRSVYSRLENDASKLLTWSFAVRPGSNLDNDLTTKTI